jgi:hypothetical protein
MGQVKGSRRGGELSEEHVREEEQVKACDHQQSRPWTPQAIQQRHATLDRMVLRCHLVDAQWLVMSACIWLVNLI